MKHVAILGCVLGLGLSLIASGDPRIINQNSPDIHLLKATITDTTFSDVIGTLSNCIEIKRSSQADFDSVTLDCTSYVEKALNARSIMPLTVEAEAPVGGNAFAPAAHEKTLECHMAEILTLSESVPFGLSAAVGVYVSLPRGYTINPIPKKNLVEVSQVRMTSGASGIVHRFIARTDCNTPTFVNEEVVSFKPFIDFLVPQENVGYRNWEILPPSVPGKFLLGPNYVVGSQNRSVLDNTSIFIRR